LGGAIPAFYGLLGILIIPWIWSLPIALIVAELGSAMPDAGGFLYWIKIGNYLQNEMKRYQLSSSISFLSSLCFFCTNQHLVSFLHSWMVGLSI
jgi:amino acid transporter